MATIIPPPSNVANPYPPIKRSKTDHCEYLYANDNASDNVSEERNFSEKKFSSHPRTKGYRKHTIKCPCGSIAVLQSDFMKSLNKIRTYYVCLRSHDKYSLCKYNNKK